MAEEITKSGECLTGREAKFAAIAARCAAEVMAEVTPKMYGTDKWPKQMGDGVCEIAMNIYRFLNDPAGWTPQ